MRVSIGIIGTGWVGSSVAISTLHAGACNELLLHDVRAEAAEGDAMDLAHGAPFYPTASVRTSSIEEMRGCAAIVVTAGRGGRPGESRLDLLKENVATIRQFAATLAGYEGLVIVVTNPVDVLTFAFRESSQLPVSRVIGTGTMLDTARLRQRLGEELGVDPRSVHAQVAGEHGDSEVVLWSGARIGGTLLRHFPRWNQSLETRIANEVRTAAAEIIKRKGATNHAIGLVTAALLKWALRGDRRVLTVSRVHEEIEGIRDVALSLPVIVSDKGAEEVLTPEMSDEERAALRRSAEVLRRAIDSIR